MNQVPKKPFFSSWVLKRIGFSESIGNRAGCKSRLSDSAWPGQVKWVEIDSQNQILVRTRELKNGFFGTWLTHKSVKFAKRFQSSKFESWSRHTSNPILCSFSQVPDNSRMFDLWSCQLHFIEDGNSCLQISKAFQVGRGPENVIAVHAAQSGRDQRGPSIHVLKFCTGWPVDGNDPDLR